MSNILDQIVTTKWREIEAAKARYSETTLEQKLQNLPDVRDFTSALDMPGEVRIIAEVKKASPSVGVIRDDFDPVHIAKTYCAHGAACLSVLTDEKYFQGHLDYLIAIRKEVDVPILRKEFILDRYQLLEARLASADAVLLIAEILPGKRLKELCSQASELGLHVLIELHDSHELQRVIDTGARLIGINNRDLRTFQTRLEHTIDLMPKIPEEILVVSESGIRSHDDLKFLAKHGISAVLVGESLMRSNDIGLALDALRGAV